MNNLCPFCLSENSLQEQTYPFSAHPMPGYTLELELKAHICAHCGEQIETPTVASINSSIISDAKLEWLSNNIELDKAIGYLVKELRNNFGVTQSKFSELTGAKGVSISKYELHAVKPSALAQTLFIVLAKSKEARSALISCNMSKGISTYNAIEPSHTSPHELITFVNNSQINPIPTITAPSIMNSVVEFIDKNLSKMFEISLGPSEQRPQPSRTVKTRKSSQNLVPVY